MDIAKLRKRSQKKIETIQSKQQSVDLEAQEKETQKETARYRKEIAQLSEKRFNTLMECKSLLQKRLVAEKDSVMAELAMSELKAQITILENAIKHEQTSLRHAQDLCDKCDKVTLLLSCIGPMSALSAFVHIMHF